MSVPAPSFDGARVALLESRLADETAALVRRLGGNPISAPAVAEIEIDADDQIEALIDRLALAPATIVVFLTGAAVTRVFATAERLGRASALQHGLGHARLVARGPKPTGALARRGLMHVHPVAEPFTTAEVIAALQDLPTDQQSATIVHYGERNASIVNALQSRGLQISELTVYEWRLPADVAPLSTAIDALIAGEIPVLAFTSQIQIRHMFEVAGARRAALLHALDSHVLVGAVGPTCAAACTDAGLRDVITPHHPKLYPRLQSLAQAWTPRSHESRAASS